MVSLEQLKEILKQSGAEIQVKENAADLSFRELGLDSMDLFNFFIQIDRDIGIEIPDDVFEELDSLEKVKAYLNMKLNA